MTANVIWAAALGLVLGFGLITVISSVPMMNQPRLLERVAPFVPTVSGAEHLAYNSGESPLGSASRIFMPLVQRASVILDRFSVDSALLVRRLRLADLSLSVAEYRLQQIAWGIAAVGIVIVLNLLMLLMSSFTGLFAFASVVLAPVIGVMARDYALGASIRRRQQQMLAEFPTLAEMLALAVSAGESAPGAFERISRASRGLLGAELARVVQQVKAGETFAAALKTLSSRIGVAPISRFLQGVVVAVERGTPLAEVMRAQAADVRELSKRDLLEAAGRKEIGMLVPLVFGILPLTVIFAVYPGLELLSIGI